MAPRSRRKSTSLGLPLTRWPASASPSPAPAPTPSHCRPEPCVTAATGCSTAASAGSPTPWRPESSWSLRTRTGRRGTRASQRSLWRRTTRVCRLAKRRTSSAFAPPPHASSTSRAAACRTALCWVRWGKATRWPSPCSTKAASALPRRWLALHWDPLTTRSPTCARESSSASPWPTSRACSSSTRGPPWRLRLRACWSTMQPASRKPASPSSRKPPWRS
mmetsp:Transcript_46614/g.120706  ORF Transcript_46614/g.120706 Transcript_46614/m.120706 type:complete len:220 (-) Transcript_46614:376-1035(-)